MRILGKRASEYSNPALRRMIRTRSVYHNGKWIILKPEMITECVKVLNFRSKRIRESIHRYAIPTLSADEASMLKQAFLGGFTHVNVFSFYSD